MRALVLSGGGAKGIFQIGVLRELLNDNPDLDYDIITGVSVGALNASMLATGPLKERLPKLEQVWLENIKGNRSIWSHHLLWYILAGIILIVLFVIASFISFIFDAHKIITIVFALMALCSLYVPFFSFKNTKSIYKTDPLRKIIEKNLDLNELKNNGKLLRVGAVVYETGEYKTGKETDDNIIDWVMASSAFPIFFPMVEIKDQNMIQNLLDGGVLNIAPLYDALELGATEVDVIICSPLDAGTEKNLGLLTQFERTLDLMGSEVLNNDIAICKAHTSVRLFMPSKSLNSSALSFNPAKIKEMYQIGKDVAKQVISNKL